MKIVLSFVAGVLVGLGFVVVWTKGDLRVKKAEERRDNLVVKMEDTRRTAFKVIDEHKKEIKQLEVKEKKEKKEIASVVSAIEEKEKYFNEIREADDKDTQIYTLQEIIQLKDKLILSQNNHINLLNTKVDLLTTQNHQLQLQLQIAYEVQDDALSALNLNLLDLKALTARDKALKIGLGVAIPLAIVGGAVGGHYLSDFIKR